MSVTVDRVKELEEEFQRTETEHPRQAAEIAYVLACVYRDAGMRDKAEQYARQSIKLFEQVGITTLQDAAAQYTVLADIALPSYIHEDVVRQAFREYQL